MSVLYMHICKARYSNLEDALEFASNARHDGARVNAPYWDEYCYQYIVYYTYNRHAPLPSRPDLEPPQKISTKRDPNRIEAERVGKAARRAVTWRPYESFFGR